MRGPQPPAMAFSDVERHDLDALTRRSPTPPHLALRAQSVVAAAAGAHNGQLARHVHVRVHMVRRWRARGRVLPPAPREALPVVERLPDAPRPGTPLRMTAEHGCPIPAVAGATPPATERPMSPWTSRARADAGKPRGSGALFSGCHAARRLPRGRCSRKPHRLRDWLPPPPRMRSSPPRAAPAGGVWGGPGPGEPGRPRGHDG